MTSIWSSLPLDGDANFALTALQRALTIELIATFRPKCCRAGDDLAEVVNRRELRAFDYVPVTDEQSVIGLLHRAEYAGTKYDSGKVVEAMRPLRGDIIISAEAGILSYVEGADERPCRLVLRGEELDGIVTLADLQKLPVRPALFLQITHVELLMAQWVRTKNLSESDVLNNLSDKRRDGINGKWKELQRNNLAIDILSATEFVDKRTLLQKLTFPATGSEMESLQLVQWLRHAVAHAGDYALTVDNAKKTVAAVQGARDWIERLQQALVSDDEDSKEY